MTINWFSVLGATVLGFGLGGLWYGPLFGKHWMRSLGMDAEAMKNAPRPGLGKILFITLVLQFFMAWCLAMFLGVEIDTVRGGMYGFLAGFFWVAFALTVNAMYEQKPWSYIIINGAYWTVNFILMGAILGTWHG